MVVGRAIAHEAEHAFVDRRFEINDGLSDDLGTESHISALLRKRQPRFPGLERRQNGTRVIANTRDDAEPGHHHAFLSVCHVCFLAF